MVINFLFCTLVPPLISIIEQRTQLKATQKVHLNEHDAALLHAFVEQLDRCLHLCKIFVQKKAHVKHALNKTIRHSVVMTFLTHLQSSCCRGKCRSVQAICSVRQGSCLQKRIIAV